METMKRKWGKPVTSVQQFTPQEYVAGCEDSTGRIPWSFKCGTAVAENYPDLTYLTQHTDVAAKVYTVEQGNNYGYWYSCSAQSHTFYVEELSGMTVTHISSTSQSPAYDNPANLYAWHTTGLGGNSQMHLFYFDGKATDEVKPNVS